MIARRSWQIFALKYMRDVVINDPTHSETILQRGRNRIESGINTVLQLLTATISVDCCDTVCTITIAIACLTHEKVIKFLRRALFRRNFVGKQPRRSNGIGQILCVPYTARRFVLWLGSLPQGRALKNDAVSSVWSDYDSTRSSRRIRLRSNHQGEHWGRWFAGMQRFVILEQEQCFLKVV